MKTQREIRGATREPFSGISPELSVALQNRRAAMDEETTNLLAMISADEVARFMTQPMELSKFQAEAQGGKEAQ